MGKYIYAENGMIHGKFKKCSAINAVDGSRCGSAQSARAPWSRVRFPDPCDMCNTNDRAGKCVRLTVL